MKIPQPAVSVRDSMVLALMPAVEITAKKLVRRLPPNVELDDLIAAGYEVAIECVENLDPLRRAQFDYYASMRIQGAMIDYLRRADPVARSVRQRIRQLKNAREEIERNNKRKPTRKEIADKLSMSLSELDHFEASAIEYQTISSVNRLTDDGTVIIVEQIVDDDLPQPDPLLKNECSLIDEMLARIPEREAQALKMYYLEEREWKNIGEQLGVTESRACQLATQGIQRLKVLYPNIDVRRGPKLRKHIVAAVMVKIPPSPPVK